MAEAGDLLVGREQVQNFERGQRVAFHPEELGLQLPPLPPVRPSAYRLVVAEVDQERGLMTLARRWSLRAALLYPMRWVAWRWQRRRYRTRR